MKNRICVAMSGGVDSTTAALLLHKNGHDITGVNMRIPYALHTGAAEAATVAREAGFPFYTVDTEKEFKKHVIEYFIREYSLGRTPNPCVRCNRFLKFGFLLEKAYTYDSEFIATGHYARIEKDNSSGRFLLKKGKDPDRDQSYFLSILGQEQLSRAMFPLGNYTKKKVRSIVKEYGLIFHDKPASQEICFVHDDYRDFIRQYYPDCCSMPGFSPGPIINADGETCGEHDGIAFYTIGQRKGLGAHGKPVYVTGLDAENNAVVIGDDSDLYKEELSAADVNWISREKPDSSFSATIKIRYNHPGVSAEIFPEPDGRIRAVFESPQRAVTPGQVAVLYDRDTVICGGWIT